MAQANDQDATEEMQQHLQFVAKKIGAKWRWLGRELKIAECDIEAIDEDYHSTHEKAFQVLEKWYQAEGHTGATKEALVETLKAIKQTSIAEELSPGDLRKEPRIAGQEKTLSPLEEKVSTSPGNFPSNIQEQQNESPSSKPTSHIVNCNNQNLIKKIEEELDKMLKICQENLSSNCQAHDHNLKIVQRLQALNTILKESSHSYNYTDEAAKVQIEKARRIRIQQTEQTARLISFTLLNRSVARQVSSTPQTNKENKPRPSSEWLPRCTSEVSLGERSNTYSSGAKPDKNSISTPLCTSQLNLVKISETMCPSPTSSVDQMCKEKPDKTGKLDDKSGRPTLEQTNAEDVEVKEEHQNSKL